MSKCRQCGVEIKDKTQVCPLCKCVLEQEADKRGENKYPNVRIRTKKWNLAVRVYLFLAIATEVLLVYLNWKYYNGTKWSIISGVGFLYVYLAARFLLINDSAGYRIKFSMLTFTGVLYLIIIDYLIGYDGWSVNYVLPADLLFIDVAIVVIMLINKRNWQSYMMFQLIMIFVSAVPLLLVKLGIVTKTFISGFAFAVSVLLFLGTLIIGDKRARAELKRRFHI